MAGVSSYETTSVATYKYVQISGVKDLLNHPWNTITSVTEVFISLKIWSKNQLHSIIMLL